MCQSCDMNFDHQMLFVLMILCSGREELLAMLATPPSAGGLEREQSQLWTYVDEELEELDVGVVTKQTD